MEAKVKPKMKYVSFCSGVEAASQAWEPLGWEPVAFSEIEPFPCAVLAARFPDAALFGLRGLTRRKAPRLCALSSEFSD